MLRQFLMATVGAVALAGSAVAADLPSRVPAPAPVFVAAPYSWSGLYIGGQIGYAWGDLNSSTIGYAAPTITSGAFFLDAPSNSNPQGVIGGVHLGYNLQIGQWLLGLEGDVDGTSVSKTVNAATFFTPPIDAAFVTPGFGATVHTTSPIQGSIRLRAGFAWDRALLYATGGAAFASVKTTYSDYYGFDSISRTRAGWTVGGGIDYAVTDNWSVRAEYRYADFGHFDNYLINSAYNPSGSWEGVHTHFTENRVQVGFSYKFGSTPAPVVAKY
ncbi:outer membrane protein [Methylocapsa acidiphila]|uniref:outer membrane protein n=1 Tax=Methylocapsa acidiphila TaxID=133552 RepID=UPI000422C07A|nr:outer membrane protein [Methylocapsa acidiphila]